MGSDPEMVKKVSYVVGILWGVILLLKWVLRKVNYWLYEEKLGSKKLLALPPGDLGWPLIGNMWSFLRAFKTGNPDSFIDSLVARYGHKGIYKVFMFGSPSVLITAPDANRKVLFDDEGFQPGWPKATMELMGRKSFIGITPEHHKKLRKMTAAPVNGHEALSIYMQYIEANVLEALEKWSKMGRIEFLTQLRKLTFRIITHIFLSAESLDVVEDLEKEYTTLNHGIRAMAINVPGFAYYDALKARTKLVAIFQSLVTKRRKLREGTRGMAQKDMLDALLETEDENGRSLDDEEIIDTLVMYLNAGHESSGHMTMWATIFLQANPDMFQKAKKEQEEVRKNMPPNQKFLTLKEFRQMEYLSKVIDETLRLVSFSFMTFREAKKDMEMGGYLIPKGWKVLLWFRSVHHNPEVYSDPKKFNPSRWDDFVPKAGTFVPFGAGTRLCPGNDLAKLEIAIFLHHFLLNYELERENPNCALRYLPHTRPVDNCLGRIKKVSEKKF